MSILKAWMIILTLLFGSIFIFFTLYIYGGVPIHNWKLHKLEKRFDIIEHSKESWLIERVSEVGLFGNSNHCDYAIGEFRQSSLTKREIKEYYQDKRIESLVQGPIPLEIYFSDEIDLDYFINGPFLDRLELWATTTKSLNSNQYLVSFIDPMNPATADYRCH